MMIKIYKDAPGSFNFPKTIYMFSHPLPNPIKLAIAINQTYTQAAKAQTYYFIFFL